MTLTKGRTLLGLGIVVSVLAIIAGVIVAGTPGKGRMERLDRMRARDLRGIMTAIDGFSERNERLPDALGELAADPHDAVSIRDPGTDEVYEYRIVDDNRYELCAVFDLASTPETRAPDPFWLHEAGRHCFALSVSPPEN